MLDLLSIWVYDGQCTGVSNYLTDKVVAVCLASALGGYCNFPWPGWCIGQGVGLR